MSDASPFFRPAWPDEEPRARELVSEKLRGLIRAKTGQPCRFYVMGKSHPVERLTGVIIWGESSVEPGCAYFGFHVPQGTPAVILAFIDSFRQFIFGQENAMLRELRFFMLVGQQMPIYQLLVQAGFAAGLVNESYALNMAQLRARLDAMKQRFGGKLALPEGSRIAFPEPSHLSGLLRLSPSVADALL